MRLILEHLLQVNEIHWHTIASFFRPPWTNHWYRVLLVTSTKYTYTRKCLLYINQIFLALTFTNRRVTVRRATEIRKQQKLHVTQSSVQIFLPIYFYIVLYYDMQPAYLKLSVNVIFLSSFELIYIYTQTYTRIYTYPLRLFSIRLLYLLLLWALQSIMNIGMIIQNAFIFRETGYEACRIGTARGTGLIIITSDVSDLHI
jgi:hypothetical protein